MIKIKTQMTSGSGSGEDQFEQEVRMAEVPYNHENVVGKPEMMLGRSAEYRS